MDGRACWRMPCWRGSRQQANLACNRGMYPSARTHADPDVKKYACQLMKETGSFAYTRAFFESSKYAAVRVCPRAPLLRACATCAPLCPCTLPRTHASAAGPLRPQRARTLAVRTGRGDVAGAQGLEPRGLARLRWRPPQGHTRVTHQRMRGHRRILRALCRWPLTPPVCRWPLTPHVCRVTPGCRAQVLRHIAVLGGNPMLEVVSFHPSSRGVLSLARSRSRSRSRSLFLALFLSLPLAPSCSLLLPPSPPAWQHASDSRSLPVWSRSEVSKQALGLCLAAMNSS